MDFSLAAKQYALHGTVTNSMMLVCAFQSWYSGVLVVLFLFLCVREKEISSVQASRER